MQQTIENDDILKHALIGYEARYAQIESSMAYVRRMLGESAAPAPAGGRKKAAKKAAGGRRQLSAAARERIAAAQRRRWKAFHKKGEEKA